MATEKSALDFIAIPVSVREMLADAPMEKVGVALMLAMYCGVQCNGGVIEGAVGWTMRQTLIRVGLNKLPAEDEPFLWEWQGENLHVLLYSVEHERKVLARRKAGRDAITARWRRAARLEDESVVDAEGIQSCNTNCITNGNTSVIRPYNDGITGCNTSKVKYKVKNKGELSSTVVSRADAEPCQPQMTWVEREAFGQWLVELGDVIPMLGRLNLDRPLPHAVQEAAEDAYRLVKLGYAERDMLRRYYAAVDVPTFRPDSLEKFFETLPDVLQHACNWCRKDDARQRKKAATDRLRAQERANAVQDVADAVSAEEAEAEFAAMRKELRP